MLKNKYSILKNHTEPFNVRHNLRLKKHGAGYFININERIDSVI